MLPKLLDYLQCLRCRSSLSLVSFSAEESRIKDGYLYCSCGEWYPIIRSVPRMLSSSLMESLIFFRYIDYFTTYRSQLPSKAQQEWSNAMNSIGGSSNLKSQTAESFGYEWKAFNKMFEAYRQNFLNYVQPFQEKDFVGKVALDAGCGVGRHTYWAAKFGAKDVIGVDLSDAVEPAEKNCRELSNAHIVQADIYNLPFAKAFDIVMSIGVLHHLPDPENGFRSLKEFLKPGGLLLIWVYGRLHNNMAVYIYESIRTITRRLPKRVVHILCHPFALFVHMCNAISDGIESISNSKRIADMVPFSYYRMFPYEVKLNDAFDVLATPKSRYYRMEEIHNWYTRAGFVDPHLSFLRKKSIIAYDRLER